MDLELKPTGARSADLWVLTARDRRQAQLFEAQLRELSALKLLPEGTVWRVVADPAGAPLGTGGATLHAICTALDMLREGDAGPGNDQPERVLAGRRVFLVHCGGLSQRLPQFAQLGKVFAPVPDQRCFPTPLLVQVFRSLAALATQASEGIFIACGDALFLCEPGEAPLRETDAAVLVAKASPLQGSAHGVYGRDPVSAYATQIVQKASPAEMQDAGLVHPDGTVYLDTGVVYLSPRVAGAWLRLLPGDAGARSAQTRFLQDRRSWQGLEFYRDVMGALVAGTGNDRLRAAFSTFRLKVYAPASGEFIHFGTTRELIRVLCERRFTGSGAVVQSRILPDTNVSDDALIHASILEGALSYVGAQSVVHFSEARGRLELAGTNYVHGLRTALDVRLPENCALYQPPIQHAISGADALVVFGVGDNPKLTVSGGATLLGEELSTWTERRGLPADEVWPELEAPRRTLWNARLFPSGTPETVLNALPWMLSDTAPAAAREAWHAQPRCSMADVARSFDSRRWRRYEQYLVARVLAAEIASRLERCEPTGDLMDAVRLLRVEARVASWLRSGADRSRRPLLAAALWQHCAALASGEMTSASPVIERPLAAARAQRRAFSSIGTAVCAVRPSENSEPLAPLALGEIVEVRAPVRIDLAGGWTDTPPQSLELGGIVLNVALDLNGEKPLLARVERIADPHLELEALDLEYREVVTEVRSLRHCSNPADPVALHKAALLEAGVVPASVRDLVRFLERAGGGLRVTSESTVPKGSGLGTSSILGAALIAAIETAVTGQASPPERLCGRVLRLEQRLSTGGGWQDQIGALYPGIKVAVTSPGPDQTPEVEELALPAGVWEELERRLVLCYTGVPRLARNVLQRVVARYLLREPAVLSALTEMRDLVQRLRSALLAGDLDAAGPIITRSWELNKQLEPTATNPDVERLFAAVAPHASGAKLAGAGGGGFMLILAREPADTAKIRQALLDAGTPPEGLFAATISRTALTTNRTAPPAV